MAKLEDRITTVTPTEVYAALRAAWRTLYGEPTREALLVLLAQWAFETGWGHAMHWYNLGNVKSSGQSGDWTFFRCSEIINGKRKWFEPDDPACRFRAYATLEAGALDYLMTLRLKYSPAWPAVLAGDPVEFVHLLKVSRYYTGDETTYAEGVRQIYQGFLRTIHLPIAFPDLYTVKGRQSVLDFLGFEPGTVDGIDGPDTREAVRSFQLAHGLIADGIAGPLTIQAMAAAIHALPESTGV